MALENGAVFRSWEEFEETLKKFQHDNSVLFVRKSSKKLASFHPEANRLIYDYLRLECKQGAKRDSTSKGLRPQQRSLKCNCRAYIRVGVTEEDNVWSLKIRGANHAHTNHPVDALTAAFYPENRRVEVTETVKALAAGDVDQRFFHEYVEETQGVRLLNQDEKNLKRKLTGKGRD